MRPLPALHPSPFGKPVILIFLARKSAISASLYPTSRRISSVCAPNSGNVETTLAGVRDKRDWLTDDADVAALGMMERHRDTKMLYLRIGKDFVELVDRACWHPLLLELFQPLRRAFCPENFSQQGGQLGRLRNRRSSVAYSGALPRSGRSSATQSARHWPSPPTPILMKPSEVSNTPIGVEYG